MKIEHKIILSNIFNVALIVLIGLFAFQNLNIMLTKLRFMEIADDLNASFLEMRLSEKNFFLYRDETALSDIREKIDRTMESIGSVKNDVVRAVGEKNFEMLNLHLKNYSRVVEEMRKSVNRNLQLEIKIRTEGKKLKEFSENITRLERTEVNDIIANSKKVLFYSFGAIFLSAVLVSHFISQKILRSLREIESLAISISEGNFRKIENIKSRDEFGSVINAINFMSDELSHREEQIVQSKKLASIGILTAGVAHELTNPLNNISMIAQTYTELYDKLSNEDRIDFMNRVEKEADRIKEIVRNLLDFSKPKEANLNEADINDVIKKTLRLVQNMLDISNIETKLNLKEWLPHVLIDEHQIVQVLVNLITNAVHAMTGGGLLFIRSKEGSNNGFVEITVADTGKGIPPEFLPHIFDPFFSTKGDKGTGLGLSVSYGIIKNHKGNIRVESKVGVGTTFTIELPIAHKGD
ncbi:two-component sensor histidine kinase [Dissulfurispira thermophila]|uniref:histidine kinase n=2 Tax=root TaxID=1 RepID=A0A7G1GZ03_9BACT|nr:ATP-binding protein [Dissulfurispira thermophila]BCB95710.1 two-component sensor histidine kinase [Dissulfurispira thermophila]